MADLHCAITDPTGLVTAVIVCCGAADPTACALKPTRLAVGMDCGPGDHVVAGAVVKQSDGVAIPVSITTRQFVLQCQSQGIWVQVKGYLGSNSNINDVFLATSVIARQDPMFLSCAQALSFTPAQCDAFFTAASAL